MDFNIPKKLSLGGVEHTVEIVPALSDSSSGQFDPICRTIQIAEKADIRNLTPSLQQQVFFHELIHAILDTMNRMDLSDDESFVNTFASFLNEAVKTMEE